MTKTEKIHPLIKYIQHWKGFNELSRKLVTYFLLKATLIVCFLAAILIYLAK